MNKDASLWGKSKVKSLIFHIVVECEKFSSNAKLNPVCVSSYRSKPIEVESVVTIE